MDNTQTNNFISVSFYEALLITVYLCIGFIPNLEAADKIAPQWLVMSVLNFIAGIYIVKNQKKFDRILSGFLKSWINWVYGLFILWAGFSFFYALNSTEVLVNISRQFNVFFMYFNMAILLSEIKHKAKFFSLVMAVILVFEVYAIFSQAFEMIASSGQVSSGKLKGVTANRNIAAFSIALKIPFVIFLLSIVKKLKWQFSFSLVLAVSFTAISMIQSRASYLAVGLIVLMFLFAAFYFIKNDSFFEKLKRIIFVLTPLIVALVVNQLYFASKGADAVSRASTISVSTNDGSVNQRLRYYQDVFTHLSSNPVFGVGLGNWKFKSIDYDKEDINGYVVPYHAHSDFIQLGAELGVIGFLTYLGIFILAAYYTLWLLFYSNIEKDKKLFIFLIFTSLGVYFIDANLNFPIARPQVLVVWSLLISLLFFYFQNEKNHRELKQPSLSKSLLFLLVALTVPSFYVSYRVYDSLKNQRPLLLDFNSNQHTISLAQLEAMDLSIPNVTVTTLPLKALKARYYFNSKKYDKALDLLNQSKESNPYLFYTDYLKSRIFETKGSIDSAYYFAKQAYFGLPNNSQHVAIFVKLAMLKKDRSTIEIAANKLKDTHSNVNWQNILTAYIDVVGANHKPLMELTERAVSLFPGNSNFLLLRKLAYVKPEDIKKGTEKGKIALEYFNNQQFKLAAENYLEAISFDPMEFSYYENAATSFYMIKDYGNAMLYSLKTIEKFSPKTGKSEYLHGISKIGTGDLSGGCEYLTKAISYGYMQATELKKVYCK